MIRAAAPPDAEVTETDDLVGIEALLAHDPGAVLLADAECAVIGSLIAAWDGWRGQLYRLALHPVWRREGVATALVRAAEERFYTLSARRVAAVVSEGHDPVRAFWQAAGYKRAAQVRFVRSL